MDRPLRLLIALLALLGSSSCRLRAGVAPSRHAAAGAQPVRPPVLYYLTFDNYGDSRLWRADTLDRYPASMTPDGVSVTSFAVLPGGEVVYATLDGIYRTRAGGEPQPLALAGEERLVGEPDVSPDGRWIAYVQGGIRLLRADGAEPPRLLTPPPPDETIHSPRWSPDGRYLLVRIVRRSGLQPLYRFGTVALASGALTGIPETSGQAGQATWTPDSRVVIASERGLALYALGDPAPRTLLAGRAVHAPLPRPDGRLLLLLPGAGGALQPHSLGIDGRGLRPESRQTYALVDPAWSPDGRYLVGLTSAQFSQRKGYSGTLQVVDMATGRLIRPPQPGPAWAVRWGAG